MDRILTYSQAIREATEQEMTRDPSVTVMGIGVDDFTGVFGTTLGLREQFGDERVLNTPLSEDAMTGAAIGAALAGLRPIHVHIRMDFLLLAMNQLVNIAAKSSYMYNGAVSVPLVVRSIIGRSWGQGPQHSQGFYPFFMHVPGLKVIAPSNPYTAKGSLIESIRDDNPVIFIEHRMLHKLEGRVPEEPYTVDLGQAQILKSGVDVTLVGISYMAVECFRAAELLAGRGINAEVIDPVSLSPLDELTILRSTEKTGRLVVVDNTWTTCGAGSEILASVAQSLEGIKNIRFHRMGYAAATCPTTKVLENQFYPNAISIAEAAYNLVRGTKEAWPVTGGESSEITSFRGPF